jgi:hypothetical protein
MGLHTVPSAAGENGASSKGPAMKKQECFYCHRKFRTIDKFGRIERHSGRGGDTCAGSYYSANWHSRELDHLAMLQQLSRKAQ